MSNDYTEYDHRDENMQKLQNINYYKLALFHKCQWFLPLPMDKFLWDIEVEKVGLIEDLRKNNLFAARYMSILMCVSLEVNRF